MMQTLHKSINKHYLKISKKMGNDQNGYKKMSQKGQRQTQLSQSNIVQDSIWQQTQTSEHVCCFTYKATTKSTNEIMIEKIIWESKFISNCQKIVQDFGWVGQLMDIVEHNQLPKVKYYKECHSLKKDKNNIKTKEPVEAKMTPEELERFKKNLRKSVIISFNSGTKAVELPTIKSSINPTRSKLQRRSKQMNQFYTDKSKPKSSSSSRSHQLSQLSKVEANDLNAQTKDVSKETSIELDIFIKFSTMLERHLSDMSCVLGRIKKVFVSYFQKKYKEPSLAAKQLDFIIESTQQFLQLLRDAVMDYYNLPTFEQPNEGSNKFISNDDNILSTVTAIIFRDHTFYNCLFNLIAYEFRQRQNDFNKILTYLRGSNPQRFTIKQKFCLNWLTIKKYVSMLKESDPDHCVENIQITDIVVEHPQPYRNCMNSLNQMAKSRAPANKLKSIMACSQGITQQIQKFYDLNGLKKEKWMLDADQILSIFCYLIVGARVEHLHTNLFILDNFSSSHQMISMTGYYLSVIRCAVEQLEIQFCDVLQQQESVTLTGKGKF